MEKPACAKGGFFVTIAAMNLYFRFFYAVLAAFFKGKIENLSGESVMRFTVLPTDLDLNGHMNNGRYLSIADIGRMDLILRLGMAGYILKNSLIPVLSAATTRYRLPLFPFQKYILKSRIVCWDEKWAFMEQSFVIASGKKAGAVAAIAILKGSFFDKSRRATVPTGDVLAAIGREAHSPPFPAHITQWQAAEDALRLETQSAES
jgi:acyl-CoA thioesterase FadM